MPEPKVVATVLAHDAARSLDDVLEGLARQTHAPRRVIVLDNGSRDADAVAAVTSRHGARLIRSDVNLGVGGGHERLFRAALADAEATHVWALEHDSLATPSCLGALVGALAELAAQGETVGALFARLERNAHEAEANAASGPPRRRLRFTFNGVLFPRETVEEIGYPRADFFVGNEDWEYAARLERANLPVFEVPAALMLHPTKGNRRFGVRPNVFRSYYSTRNWMRYRIEQGAIAGALGACAWCAVSLGAILLRDDRKVARVVARVTATGDALLNRMGPRSYWFLRS